MLKIHSFSKTTKKPRSPHYSSFRNSRYCFFLDPNLEIDKILKVIVFHLDFQQNHVQDPNFRGFVKSLQATYSENRDNYTENFSMSKDKPEFNLYTTEMTNASTPFCWFVGFIVFVFILKTKLI